MGNSNEKFRRKDNSNYRNDDYKNKDSYKIPPKYDGSMITNDNNLPENENHYKYDNNLPENENHYKYEDIYKTPINNKIKPTYNRSTITNKDIADIKSSDRYQEKLKNDTNYINNYIDRMNVTNINELFKWTYKIVFNNTTINDYTADLYISTFKIVLSLNREKEQNISSSKLHERFIPIKYEKKIFYPYLDVTIYAITCRGEEKVAKKTFVFDKCLEKDDEDSKSILKCNLYKCNNNFVFLPYYIFKDKKTDQLYNVSSSKTQTSITPDKFVEEVESYIKYITAKDFDNTNINTNQKTIVNNTTCVSISNTKRNCIL